MLGLLLADLAYLRDEYAVIAPTGSGRSDAFPGEGEARVNIPQGTWLVGRVIG